MTNIKTLTRQLWQDESAQGATEYILLLVVIVALFMAFKEQILGMIKQKMGSVSGKIMNFNPQ